VIERIPQPCQQPDVLDQFATFAVVPRVLGLLGLDLSQVHRFPPSAFAIRPSRTELLAARFSRSKDLAVVQIRDRDLLEGQFVQYLLQTVGDLVPGDATQHDQVAGQVVGHHFRRQPVGDLEIRIGRADMTP
jgi:hypothetical protein